MVKKSPSPTPSLFRGLSVESLSQEQARLELEALRQEIAYHETHYLDEETKGECTTLTAVVEERNQLVAENKQLKDAQKRGRRRRKGRGRSQGSGRQKEEETTVETARASEAVVDETGRISENDEPATPQKQTLVTVVGKKQSQVAEPSDDDEDTEHVKRSLFSGDPSNDGAREPSDSDAGESTAILKKTAVVEIGEFRPKNPGCYLAWCGCCYACDAFGPCAPLGCSRKTQNRTKTISFLDNMFMNARWIYFSVVPHSTQTAINGDGDGDGDGQYYTLNAVEEDVYQ